MTAMETGIDGWAILELVGRRRLGGKVREATIAGGVFIRIDVPHPNETGVFTATRFYAPSAVYAITLTTEEMACAIARGAREAVSRWNPRSLTASTGQTADDDAIATILAELDDAHEVDEDADEPLVLPGGAAGRR
jgi:hypothetical protein